METSGLTKAHSSRAIVHYSQTPCKHLALIHFRALHLRLSRASHVLDEHGVQCHPNQILLQIRIPHDIVLVVMDPQHFSWKPSQRLTAAALPHHPAHLHTSSKSPNNLSGTCWFLELFYNLKSMIRTKLTFRSIRSKPWWHAQLQREHLLPPTSSKASVISLSPT